MSVVVGVPLTGTDGVWQGTGLTFTRRWLKNGAPLVAGAGYTPVAADLGSQLEFEVTATNSSGSLTKKSKPRLVVAAGAFAVSGGSYPSLAVRGAAYSWAVPVTGGVRPLTATRNGPALPTGVVFDSETAVLSADVGYLSKRGGLNLGDITITDFAGAQVILPKRAVLVAVEEWTPYYQGGTFNYAIDPGVSSVPNMSAQRHADFGTPFSLSTSLAYPGAIRYAISKGEDDWSQGLTYDRSKRAELYFTKTYTENEPVSRSYSLRVEGANPLSSALFDNWLIFGQMHYTPFGNETSVSPPLEFSLEPDGMHVVTRTAAATPVLAPNLISTTRGIIPFSLNVFHDFVIQVVPGQGGTGSLKVWMDTVLHVDVSGVDIGYPGAGRTYYWKEGVYAGVARPEDKDLFIDAGGILTATYRDSKISDSVLLTP